MIGAPYKIINKYSEEFFEINNQLASPVNFIALQSYPTMELEVRNDEIIKEGQHGVWDFFSFYGKRVITFEGVIVGENEAAVQTLANKMNLVSALPSLPTMEKDGTMIIQWTDPLGKDWQIEGKLQSSIRFGRSMKQKYRLDFIMTIKCSNPTIESQELTESDGLRGWSMGSLRLPATIPAIIDIINLNVVEVENEGSQAAFPIVRMYGCSLFPLNNPKITNLGTGEYMKITAVLADPTEWIEIDNKLGTVVDQDGADLSGSVAVGSTFVTVQPGTNEFFYTSDESEPDSPLNPVADRRDPLAVVEITHRDTQ